MWRRCHRLPFFPFTKHIFVQCFDLLQVEELYKLRVENKQMAQKLKTVLQENTNIKRTQKEKEERLTLKVQKLTTKLAEKTALVHEFANFKDNQ